LPDAAFVAELIRRYDAIPQVILDEPDLMALFLPMLKADFALFETHEHQKEPPLDCALAIYGGAADPQTAEMEGWAELIAGPCRRRRFPGGHFYLAERRAALAAALAEDILTPFPAA
jgi:surfactin synthase thioesterase subunit